MALQPNSSGKLPRNGTSNQNTATSVTRITSNMPMRAYGSNLPTISSQRASGVTLSCSSVPTSRSRTMAMADRLVVTTSSSSATMPGTMKSRLSSRGLNHTRMSASIGAMRGRPGRRSAVFSAENDATTFRA